MLILILTRSTIAPMLVPGVRVKRANLGQSGAFPFRQRGIPFTTADFTGFQEITGFREDRMEKLRAFIKDESGQDLVEYAMLLALIVLAALTGVGTFGGSAGEIWNDLATTTAGYLGS